MNGNNLLIDSNIILYLLNGDRALAQFLSDKRLYVSVISEIETLSYPPLTPNDISVIHNFFQELTIIELTSEIKQKSIEVHRNYRLKLPDAIIAATALYYSFPLFSADSIFERIEPLNFLHYDLA